MAAYEIGIIDPGNSPKVAAVRTMVAAALGHFGLALGTDVGWVVGDGFDPRQDRGAVLLLVGGGSDPMATVTPLLDRHVPIVPVASTLPDVPREIPAPLRHLNCLAWEEHGPERVAVTLLECLGLLPRQRRVFLSYRRDESREVALQLFDAFSARQFDVFLDTHGVPPAVDFQAMLWHRLCESDVLVMLDTPHYFDSRWSAAEYARALAKGIAVLRIQWPDHTPSIRTSTASRAELLREEIDAQLGQLNAAAVQRICDQLEHVRSEGHAVRRLNLVSKVKQAITQIGGEFHGVGVGNAIYLALPDGRPLSAFPTVGVPSARTMHTASLEAPGTTVAVVFEPIGMLPDWLEHLAWLGGHIRSARWVDVARLSWDLADWA